MQAITWAVRQFRMRALLLLVLPLAAAPAWACPPVGYDKPALQELKARKLQMHAAAKRDALALALLDCLASLDPELRDGIAYEFLTHWMRSGDFDAPMLRRVRDGLYARLDGAAGAGFVQPFAALVLSEVARTDRVAPWMSADERDAMLRKAAGYVEAVRDYRGYDAAQGWRHGVAHGADWLMQLALNPALRRDQADLILGAVAAQAVPASNHAYVFGEPARLAQPVLFVARRGLLDADDWSAWFAALPARLGAPALAYKDAGWLARRHDLVAFLQGLYVEADASQDAHVRALKPAVQAALKAVP
jgi:hypothetical protein